VAASAAVRRYSWLGVPRRSTIDPELLVEDFERSAEFLGVAMSLAVLFEGQPL
jgi:hypothetical protein